MSEAASKAPSTPAAGAVLAGAPESGAARPTAGGLLRAARQARGMHVEALAASIKVTQRKLESLEADRYDELPDMTFTRALAKTICRSLKIDPEPVLALLPQIGGGLDKVHQGLNTSFRDRPSRLEPTDLSVLARPAVWVPLLLVLAAAAIYLLPQSWIADLRSPSEPASAPAADVATPASAALASPAGGAVAAPEAAPVAAAAPPPTSAPASQAEAGLAAPPADLNATLELRASGETWVEVVDGHGATLLQRALQPGEAVGLDGTPPFKLKIGNALRTQLRLRGQPVDLAPSTRDNVARLELK